MTPEQKKALALARARQRAAAAKRQESQGQPLGVAVASAMNKAGEAATLGLVGDEAAAGFDALIGRGSYDERLQFYRDQEEALEENSPGLALGSEVGGAVLGALLPGGAIGTLARGASMPARIAASAGAGAGVGGLYGFMEGEGLEGRVSGAKRGAAFGAGAGVAAPVIGAGIQRLADNVVSGGAIRRAARNAPSAEELRRQGQALYKQVDAAGVQVKPEAFNNARMSIMDDLQSQTAFSTRPGGRTLTPNTSAVVGDMAEIADELAGAAGSNPGLPLRELDGLRRQAGAAAGNVTNKSDAKAGMQIIQGLDDMIENLGPDDVLTGDLQALKSALPKARETWARMSKAQKIEDAMEKSESYLSGGASAVRNQFASILRSPKLSRGFSEAEKKAMKRVVSGTLPQQIMNYMGGGLGMMGQMGLGAAVGGFPGFLAGTAGAAASRKASEAMTMRNAEIARAFIANGGLPQLPVASQGLRRLLEETTRRTGGASAQ